MDAPWPSRSRHRQIHMVGLGNTSIGDVTPSLGLLVWCPICNSLEDWSPGSVDEIWGYSTPNRIAVTCKTNIMNCNLHLPILAVLGFHNTVKHTNCNISTSVYKTNYPLGQTGTKLQLFVPQVRYGPVLHWKTRNSFMGRWYLQQRSLPVFTIHSLPSLYLVCLHYKPTQGCNYELWGSKQPCTTNAL